MRKSYASTAEDHQIQEQRSQKKARVTKDSMAAIKSEDPPEKARKNAAIPKKIDFPCFLSCSKKNPDGAKKSFISLPEARKPCSVNRWAFASCSAPSVRTALLAPRNPNRRGGPATQLQKGMHVDFPKKQTIQENAQRSDALLIPKQRLQKLDRDQKWSEQSEIGEE